MQIQSSLSARLYQDLVGDLPAQVPLTKKAPELPVWVQDSFIVEPASQLMQQIGHTALGRAVNDALSDPFLFLNRLGIGGFRGNIASANASFAGQVASTRFAGTVIGGVIGAATGVGQALMTFPGTGTAIVAGLHGLVAGAAAGNVSVLEHRLQRMESAQSQPLW